MKLNFDHLGASIASLAVPVPGVGPVVTVGWLAATAVGAAAGAATGGAVGGIAGALTDAGVSPENANVFVERLRQGGSLVTASVDYASVTEATLIMRRANWVDPEQRRIG